MFQAGVTFWNTSLKDFMASKENRQQRMTLVPKGMHADDFSGGGIVSEFWAAFSRSRLAVSLQIAQTVRKLGGNLNQISKLQFNLVNLFNWLLERSLNARISLFCGAPNHSGPTLLQTVSKLHHLNILFRKAKSLLIISSPKLVTVEIYLMECSSHLEKQPIWRCTAEVHCISLRLLRA